MQFASLSRFTTRCLSVLALTATMAAVAVGDHGSAKAAIGFQALTAPPAAADIEAFVQSSINRGYTILNDQKLDADQREAQFRDFVRSITDTKRVALFTLGEFSRTASESDLKSFLEAYDDFTAAMYQGYFNWYTGQSLRVANSIARSADDVVVYADVVQPDGSRKYKVGFRVRKDDTQRNIVTDFQFEGVWLALNQRTDFTAYLQQHRGNFTALTAELKKRTEQFKTVWAPPKR